MFLMINNLKAQSNILFKGTLKEMRYWKAIKNPQPCKEINTLFYHLDIFQGVISPFSIGSLSEVKQANIAWSVWKKCFMKDLNLSKRCIPFLKSKLFLFLFMNVQVNLCIEIKENLAPGK